jgi:hypothetical protein
VPCAFFVNKQFCTWANAFPNEFTVRSTLHFLRDARKSNSDVFPLWNKNHIPPPRKPRGISRWSYRSLTGKVRGIRNASPVVDVVSKCLRQRSKSIY